MTITVPQKMMELQVICVHELVWKYNKMDGKCSIK